MKDLACQRVVDSLKPYLSYYERKYSLVLSLSVLPSSTWNNVCIHIYPSGVSSKKYSDLRYIYYPNYEVGVISKSTDRSWGVVSYKVSPLKFKFHIRDFDDMNSVSSKISPYLNKVCYELSEALDFYLDGFATYPSHVEEIKKYLIKKYPGSVVSSIYKFDSTSRKVTLQFSYKGYYNTYTSNLYAIIDPKYKYGLYRKIAKRLSTTLNEQLIINE